MNGLEIRRPTTRTLVWGLLVVLLVLYGFPFLYLGLTSLKTPLETIAVPPKLLPTHWTFANYSTALHRDGVPRAILNSVVTAGLSTVISLLLAVPAAYGVTRFKTRLGQWFIMGALVTRMVPPVAIGIPLLTTRRRFSTHRHLGPDRARTHHDLAALLICLCHRSGTQRADEAAKIDGCSRLAPCGEWCCR